jgi:hypothetical protein
MSKAVAIIMSGAGDLVVVSTDEPSMFGLSAHFDCEVPRRLRDSG